MSLSGYGILYGTVVTVRPPRPTGTHWLVVVQPLDATHPTYRVAIELGGPPKSKIGIEGQWCDLSEGTGAAQGVGQRLIQIAGSAKAPGYFLTKDGAGGVQAVGLDYVRSGIVPAAGFAATTNSLNDPVALKFAKFVVVGAKVAVCGTGSPTADEAAAHTGFTGVANVHMNQGTRPWIRNLLRYEENGAYQDGALFVLDPNGVQALFLKYASQSLNSDATGTPQDTGVASVDQVLATQQPMVMAYEGAQAQEAAQAAAAQAQAQQARAVATANTASAGFAFQEPPGVVLDDPFVADDDHLVRNNAIAQAYAQGKAQAPEYIRGDTTSLVMNLADVRGQAFVHNLASEITFDLIGDTGATSATTYAGEMKVTTQLCALAQVDLPAFCFHVGDVVYFYGEPDYVPCQFAIPFKDYPAPIFAIPGNHDACVYDEQHTPLQAFIEVFCADKPTNSGVLGGVNRTTMTQPGTYFTLDAPYVSIIGLFSGAAESIRYMSKAQQAHFYSELVRIQQLRAGGDHRAIILAVHHLPQFYAASPGSMSTGLDDACQRAGVWPDAVVVGHAHLYQRFFRTVGSKKIPYIVCGNGGYKISPGQDAKVTGKPQVSGNLVINKLGFVRATSDGRTLSFKAIGVDGDQLDTVSAALP